MPGGKLHYGESFEQGAIREVVEETGIQIQNPKVIAVNQDLNEHAHFITVGLLSENCEEEPKVMEPDKCVEWKWCDIDNLPEQMFEGTHWIIRNFKAKRIYKPAR